MLQAGATIPDVSLTDERGIAIPIRTLLLRPLVLFFYPKDETPGCTAEVCAFRDEYDRFVEAGAEVIGVSSDNAVSHERFRAKHALPFPLYTDPGGAARRAFDIPKTFGLVPGRATFVIGEDARIVYAFNSQFAPQLHVKNALDALRNRSMSSASAQPGA